MYVRLVFVLFKRISGGVGGLTGAREVLLSENLSGRLQSGAMPLVAVHLKVRFKEPWDSWYY